jgi:hypothetical protein
MNDLFNVSVCACVRAFDAMRCIDVDVGFDLIWFEFCLKSFDLSFDSSRLVFDFFNDFIIINKETCAHRIRAPTAAPACQTEPMLNANVASAFKAIYARSATLAIQLQ